MCGIAGCVAPSGQPADREAVARMVAALDHRGPDDAGVEVFGNVALGAARLAILDPSSAGHQPLATRDRRRWLVHNGEVFNHAELRRELGDRGWRGHSDTETLVHAVHEWGDGAFARFEGFFALAHLDLDAARLVLARDRFGVKPLYLAHHRDSLWFASEIGALLAAGVPARPHAEVLERAVGVGWANGGATPIDGIERLLPGHLLELDTRAARVAPRPWARVLEQLDPERARELAARPPAELAAELETSLRRAVERRLLADVPVGVMCSGGLDSSLLTRLAADHHPRIHAFCASLPDQPDWDERPAAELVATATGVELHVVETTDESWRRDLVTTVKHIEYPLLHPSSVPMAQIARLARATGMKALLSGEGADELFGGYPWVSESLVRDFRARRRPLEAGARAARRALRRAGVLDPEPPWPPPARAHAVRDYEDGVRRMAAAAYAQHRGTRATAEAALGTLPWLYLPHLLNRQDKATMQWSIETREPYLDGELAALALNLPLEWKVEPDRKQPLRELATRLLPPSVATRPKVGFGMDTHTLIVPHARPEFLLDGRLAAELPDWPRLAAGIDPLLSWTGEIWARLFLEGQAPSEVEEALWRPSDC